MNDATPAIASVPSAAAPAPPKPSRFNQFKPYLAPMLISIILLAGELTYGILQSYWHTALAIGTAIVLEIALSWFATGRFPHLASAYITGISVGILVRTPIPWLFALCSILSISSKYALRVRGRHLWNPSNLGVSVLLFLVPQSIAPLSLEWGNFIWVPIIILCFGFLILYTLGRLHITLTYVIAFSVLSMVRSAFTGHPLEAELGLITAPSYLLFMFFMITDPKTTPLTWWRQIGVTIIVAVVETILRFFENPHAPYYALFIVFPIANLTEVWWESRVKSAP
jgi:Na+-translocating ferredoxin:NAD+ oxidoreductase RnfD subunit